MKKTIITILIMLIIGVVAIMLFGCSDNKAEQAQSGSEPASADASAKDAARDTDKDVAEGAAKCDVSSVTGLRFSYDNYSGKEFELNVYVENMSEEGAKVTVEKRVGPMNYTGHTKEGELKLTGGQAAELKDILSRYDLKAWSELPTRGYGYSPTRSLIVFSGNDILYKIMWSAVFPKTLPPEEDIMYAELFNFFNDIIASEPGWEEVRSDNLDDPRDNPAYYEREVTWFGNIVKLVPGTGVWYEDGRGATIDYEGKDWWVEEGFVGEWTLDEENPTGGLNDVKDASLTVRQDGTVLFVKDGEEWTGTVDPGRKYKAETGIALEKDNEYRNCEVYLYYEESYERISVTCYPGPVPEPQFAPIDVNLIKVDEN